MRAPLLISLVIGGCGLAVVGWRTGSFRIEKSASVLVHRTSAEPLAETAGKAAAPAGSSRDTVAPATEADAATGPANDVEKLRQLFARKSGQRVALAEVRRTLFAALATLTGAERADLLSEVGAWMGANHPAMGLELAGDLEELRDSHVLVRAAIETMVGQDPLRAAEWVAQLRDPALRESAYNVLGMKWAEADVTAAREWAMSLPAGEARASVCEGLVWTWAQRDADAAYRWAVGLEDAGMRDQAFVKLAKMIAVAEPQRALAWAQQFPPGAARDQAMQYAIFHWAAADLQGATEWAARMGDKALQHEIEVAIARSWSNQEAQGATAWAAGIRDPAAQAMALKTTVRKWAEVDPGAAAQWIAGRGDTPANEDVFRSVTAALAVSRPAAAAEWLKQTPHASWRAIGVQLLPVASTPTPAVATGAPVPKG